MNKYTIILIVILVILIIFGSYWATKMMEDYSRIKVSKSQNVSSVISNIIQSLEECQGSSQAINETDRNKYQFCSYDISDENLTKLKSLQSIDGKEICNFFDRDCKLDDYLKDNSQQIWKFEWETIIVRRNCNYLSIEKTKSLIFFEKYYLIIRGGECSGSPQKTGSIYSIKKLDDEIIQNLK